MPASGVVLYPKPAGVTSHDVVATVRKVLREQTGEKQRVGHAGTLDPFATGLLLVLVGSATRMQRFLMALPKTYRAVARLGWTSDTGDVDGELVQTGRVPEELVLPTGELMQRPPAYSAVKVDGERLYKKARRGEEVEGEPRPVTVYRFEELWRDGDRVGLEVECSAGTYIRQLVADLGDAYCEELERTAIGDFKLADADLEKIVPLEEALAFLPEFEVDGDEARRASDGGRVTGDGNGFTRLMHEGRLIAIAEPRDGFLKPTVVIPSVNVVALPDCQPRSDGGKRKVAIGTFDGVHLGHRAVIKDMDTVLTFEPHPLAVVAPHAQPKLIQTFNLKRDLIAGLGVEDLVVIPFNRSFAEHSAEEFVDEVLIKRLNASHVAVGENFRFGKGARGDAEFLSARPEFETRVVPLVEVAGETVSSSHIRGLVAAGDVAAASEFLGGPFLFEGEVVHGDKRGRELGMPTANLVPDDKLAVPGHGVYAGWAHGHPAAINVGVRPTFQTGRGLLIEAYLLDFSGDLYGQNLRIAFIERLRGEKRFESVEALVEQMKRDVDQARAICAAPR